jgi:hypothetical protein
VIRHSVALLFASCLVGVSAASAQVPQSIAINGAPSGNFYTGAFVELTATGTFAGPGGPITFPVYVNWTSSDPTVVSIDNASGVATALKGSATPITITATVPGVEIAPASIQIPSVLPQTALYAADGNTLTVYDVTFAQNPTLVTTVNYLTSTGQVNNKNAVPMALSSDERYLFIASPGYYSTTSSNFTVVAIDTQTFQVAATVSASLLCYPTSIAVAGENLYVVNAGPSVAQNAAATDGGCASGATHPSPNVEMYSIADVPLVQAGDKTWTPVSVTQAANSSSTDAFSYVPISVAASSDQGDGLVYVGSVANLSGSTFDSSLISSFTSGSTTRVSQVVMPKTSNLAVAPLGLSVTSAYPSWDSLVDPVFPDSVIAVHTVAFTGPGVVSSASGEYLGYFSDQCQSTTQTSGCTVGGTTTPATVAFTSGAVTSAPFWLSTDASPNGEGFYAAVNDYLYFFSSTDGTSSNGGFGAPTVFDTEGVGAGQCTSCLPVTSVTTKSDESTIYASSIGQIDVLEPDGFTSTYTVSPIQARSILVSQHPEIKLTLIQNGITISSKTNFTVSGNFQKPGSVYEPSCAWGAGQPPWNTGGPESLQSTTEQQFFPNPPDYSQVPPQNVQIIPAISRDANDPPGSIIVGVSVGPVTTEIAAASGTVPLGGTDTLSAQVTNANANSAIASWLVGTVGNLSVCTSPGSGCPFGTIDQTTGIYTAPSALPPSSVQVCALPAAIDPTTITGVAVCSNSPANSGTPYSNSITLTLLTPLATPNTSSVSFSPPSQTVGTTSGVMSVTLTNTGQANLILAATPLSISGTNAGDFAIAAGTTCVANQSIALNGSCVVNLTFTPTAVGSRSATLTITDDSGGIAGSTQPVSLSGTGQSVPMATLSASSITFSTPQNVGTTSGAMPVTVTNTGQTNLVLSATPLAIGGANAGDFAIAAGTTCTASLSIASNGTCLINVTFTPSAAGTRNASLSVTDNSGGTAGSMQSVSLTGTGQTSGEPTASVSPTSLTFAVQNVQTTSAAQPITVTNTGQANLVLSAAPLSITGANAGDYAIAAGTTCTANLSIAPNGKCLINVTFDPSGAGTRNAMLGVTDNSGGTAGTTQTVALTGTGQVLSPTATVNPPTLTFNSQSVGTTSASMSVTVTNTGQGNLILGATSTAVSGANASDYAIASGTTCIGNLSIAPNGTCLINVAFSPSAAGTRTATLTVTDNSGGIAGSTQTVALSGTATSLSLFPSTPQVEAGGSQAFTLLPANSGAITWSVSGTGCGGHACGTVDANGTYSVPTTLANFAVDTVKAAVTSTPSLYATTQVTVFLKPALSSGQSQTVTAGQSATYSLSLGAGTGDSAKPLIVQCFQETLPTGVSCQAVSIQPGTAAVNFSFVVQTTGSQTAAIASNKVLLGGVLILPMCAIFMLRRRREFRLVLLVAFASATLFCLGISGCGTNGSFGPATPKTFGGTPAGSYTIELDGVGPSGIPEKIGTIGLIVQ